MASTAMVTGRLLRCGTRRSTQLFGVGLVAALDHFLATIKTIGRDAMTGMSFAGRRIDRQCRTIEAVVRAVHAALGRGLSAFLNRHDYSPTISIRCREPALSLFAQQVPQIQERLM